MPMSVNFEQGCPLSGEHESVKLPHVRVVFATDNDAQWLDAQLVSMFMQEGAHVSVVASDDSSTAGTPAFLKAWVGRNELMVLQPAAERFGSAHSNFLRLIRDTALGDAEYFVLSDQDDIWLPPKPARGITCLRNERAQLLEKRHGLLARRYTPSDRQGAAAAPIRPPVRFTVARMHLRDAA